MRKSKYIIHADEMRIVVFSDIIDHDHVSFGMGWSNSNIHSAGFIRFLEQSKENRQKRQFCQCYGDSYTLSMGTVEASAATKKKGMMSSTEIANRQLFPELFPDPFDSLDVWVSTVSTVENKE